MTAMVTRPAMMPKVPSNDSSNSPTPSSPGLSWRGSSDAASQQKKRRQVTVACNQCRKRKSKCDGTRPGCAACSSRNSECHYEADPDASPIVALKRKYEQLQKDSHDNQVLLEMLKTRPEAEAIVILKRMRTHDTTSSALSFVNDADVLLPNESPRRGVSYNVLPSFSELTEFELPSRHSSDLPVLPPVRVPSIDSLPHFLTNRITDKGGLTTTTSSIVLSKSPPQGSPTDIYYT